MFFQIDLFVFLMIILYHFVMWTLISFQGFCSLLHLFLNINCDHFFEKNVFFADLSATLSNTFCWESVGWFVDKEILPSDEFMYFTYSPPARWGLLDFIRAVLLLLLRLRIRLLHLLRLLLAVQIPVGTAGPPPRAPDPSGHCRTSTASARSQWALPDLHRELQIPVGTAGPQPRLPGCSGHCRTSTATSRSQWALPDLNGKNVRKDVR